jgi:hypothetical protein
MKKIGYLVALAPVALALAGAPALAETVVVKHRSDSDYGLSHRKVVIHRGDVERTGTVHKKVIVKHGPMGTTTKKIIRHEDD